MQLFAQLSFVLLLPVEVSLIFSLSNVMFVIEFTDLVHMTCEGVDGPERDLASATRSLFQEYSEGTFNSHIYAIHNISSFPSFFFAR